MPNLRSQFRRTQCSCAGCVAACQTMPGSLVPGDLDLILQFTGKAGDPAWLLSHFVASEGALILRNNQPVRVPTIVPAQRPDGSCVFLENNRCTIHPVAPFGCAYNDVHMGPQEGTAVSRAAVVAQLTDYMQEGEHSATCQILALAGCVAPPLEERRGNFEAALHRLGHVFRESC